MDTVERLRTALAGRYRVERELGQGGMAVVYLAHDEKHGRPVAIKVLRPDVAAAMGAERFLREIEIAAQLNHPNVLGLHDSGQTEGLLYFVMPFIEGESLRDRLDREGALPFDEAHRVVREVGSALAFAHERGLVHRDIKPENILFQAGHALVCDFGIAKAASEAQERLTRTGMSVGTFTYMSPEQMADGEEVDARADVYALGCVLYEMLGGEAPFQASTPQAAYGKKLLGEVASLAEVRPELPPTVEAVVEKALAVDPGERHATAESFVAALDTATSLIAVQAEERRRTRARVTRWTTAMIGVALLAAAGVGVASFLSRPLMARVAVVPAPSPDEVVEREFFVRTVSEELAWEFARAGIRVTSPNSSLHYADSSTPTRSIADSLGVDGLVQVAATAVAGQVTIDVRLFDGDSEEVVWVDEFAGPERNILALYGEVTRALADELGVALSEETLMRLAAAPQVDPQLFEALRAARYEWHKLTEEGFNNALGYYDLAISLDSTSAEAWFGRSRVWPLMAQQGLVTAAEAAERAAPDRARARELDPGLAQLQAGLALDLTWSEWAFDEAEVAFRNALEREPTDAATRAYFSLLLLYRGRPDEAAAEIARAAEQDPFSSLVQGLRSQNLIGRDRYEEAERVLTAALARDPNDPFLLAMLRTTYHVLGEYDAALESWRASFTPEGSYATAGDPEAAAALEQGFSEGGYSGALAAVADLQVRRLAEGQSQSVWGIGTLYVRAGRYDLALDYLERAFEARNGNVPYLLIDPIFDPLRDEPRFQAMIEALQS